MATTLEESNILNAPIECFDYDTSVYSFPIKPHWHYYMEILYIEEGTALVQSDKVNYTVGAGEFILIMPKNIHSIDKAPTNPLDSKSSSEKLRYAVLKFDVNRFSRTASYAPKLRSILKAAEAHHMAPLLPKKYVRDEHLDKLFANCLWEMKLRNYGYDQLLVSYIYEIMIKVLRFWQEHGFLIDQEVYEEDENYDIYSITEYIDAHLSDGLLVTELAELCRLSYSCFAKKFQAIYGKTCKDYIEHIRLFKVEALLQFTDFDLTYIAQETGYSDCSHMIKSFKKSRGTTPKQYRLARQKSLA